MPTYSIQEAEALLGRSLTTLETMWMNGTKGLEDYHLYCATVFLLLAFYPLACLPYFILDYLKLPFFEKYRLQPGSYNTPAAVWACLRSVITVILTTILPLQLISYPFFKIAGITGHLPLPPLRHMALQLAVFFLVEDYGNYWVHRALHSPWGFARIHYKHHEYSTPCSFSATYAHWAEVLLLGVPSFVGPAIVRCHVVTLWAWILLRQWEAIETHSGYDFPWSITRLIPFYGGAEFHDYHHEVGGLSRGNFASIFTYCDYLYGTDKGYKVKKSLKQQQAKKAE
eukprot:jgi/Mesen1/2840/ME000174S02092